MKKILISLLAALTVGTSSVSTFAMYTDSSDSDKLATPVKVLDMPLPDQTAFQRPKYIVVSENDPKFDIVLADLSYEDIEKKLREMLTQDSPMKYNYCFSDGTKGTREQRIVRLIYDAKASSKKSILKQMALLYGGNELTFNTIGNVRYVIIFNENQMPPAPVRA